MFPVAVYSIDQNYLKNLQKGSLIGLGGADRIEFKLNTNLATHTGPIRLSDPDSKKYSSFFFFFFLRQLPVFML